MLTLKKWIGILFLQLMISFNKFSEIFSATDVYHEDNVCQWKGIKGICTSIDKCATLGNANRTDIQRCPYNGTELIVCCTDVEVTKLFHHTKRVPRLALASDFLFPDDDYLKNVRESKLSTKTPETNIRLTNSRASTKSPVKIEGSVCQSKGEKGTCTLIDKCEPLRNAKPNEIERCDHRGPEMIICCYKPHRVVFLYDHDRNDNPREQFQPTPKTPLVISRFKTPKTNTKRRVEIECDIIKKRFAGEPVTHFIVGDRNDAEPGEFPHMAALGFSSNINGPYIWGCGGSLISDRYILTAAHCVYNDVPKIVRMGRNNIKEDDFDNVAPTDIAIENVMSHKKYKWSESYFDVALIKLKKPVDFQNGLHPACLYTNPEDLNETVNLTITGWGSTDLQKRTLSDILQKAIVRTVPLDKCKAIPAIRDDKNFPMGIIDTQLCAYNKSSDSCQGDSGGPLHIQDNYKVSTIIGITSIGNSCGSEIPGIYTRVARYLDWIESIVWPESGN